MSSVKNLAKTSASYMLLVAIGSSINLGFYPIISKLLTKEDYANIGVFNAISLQYAAIFVALGLIVINIYRNNERETARKKVLATQKLVLKIFIALLVAGILFSPLIKNYLNLPDYRSLALLIPYTLISIPTMFLGGYHQNSGSFIIMGFYNIVLAITKLIFSIVFAWISPELISIVLALLLSQIAGLIFLALPLKKHELKEIFNHKNNKSVPIDIQFILTVTCTVFVLLLLTNIDILMIKNRFDDVAWMYIGPAMVTNGFIFFSTSLAYILVSKVGSQKSIIENQKYFVNTLKLWVPVAFFSLVFVAIFSEYAVKNLLGLNYFTKETVMLSTLSIVFYCSVGLYYIFNLYLLSQKIYAGLLLSSFFLALSVLFGLILDSINSIMIALIVLSFVANLIVGIIIIKTWRKHD